MSQYTIQVEYQTGETSVVPLKRFPFTVGRGPENDLVIAEAAISRRHADFQIRPEGLAVVDNKSRNGILVNRKRVSESQILNPGDKVRIGSVKIVLLPPADLDFPGESDASDASEKTIQFVTSQASWDPSYPLTALTGGLREAAAGPAQALKNLKWILQLFRDSPVSEVYEHILDTVHDAVPFDRCFLIHFGGNEDQAEIPDQIKIIARRDNTSEPSKPIVSREILNRVARSGEAAMVTTEDRDFQPTESFIQSGASGAICVPLKAGGKVIGVIYLDRILGLTPLSLADIEVLGPLAGIVALKVENIRLMNDRLSFQINEKELSLAKSIQEGLLPQEEVRLPGYSVDGYSSPCYQVGGDYFDFFHPDESSFILIIGDISGKGLPSSLYMAGIRAALHAHLEDGLGIALLMSRLEKQILSSFRPDYFLTLFMGKLELKTGRLVYCNAGHYRPFLLRVSGELVELEVTDPALNVMDSGEFHCAEITLEPGDTVLLYTDGLTDDVNSKDERFGKDRLLESFRRWKDEEVQVIRQNIFEETESFAGPDNSGDDKTMILCRRNRVNDPGS